MNSYHVCLLVCLMTDYSYYNYYKYHYYCSGMRLVAELKRFVLIIRARMLRPAYRCQDECAGFLAAACGANWAMSDHARAP